MLVGVAGDQLLRSPERGVTVQFGAHLPLIDLGIGLPTVDDLIAYARRARETGFRISARTTTSCSPGRGSTVRPPWRPC